MKKIRYAVVGTGWISQISFMPGVEQTGNSEMTAIVSGNRANAEKLAQETVAIIGVGGTGGYILDQVAKTPAPEIRLFDADEFMSHNAFRAPGAASLEELRELPIRYLSVISYRREE